MTSYAKKPFAPILEGEENWDAFAAAATDYLLDRGLWYTYVDPDHVDIRPPFGRAATPEMQLEWKIGNGKVLGILRGNMVESIRILHRAQSSAKTLWLELTEAYGARSDEEAHLVLGQFMTRKMLENDNIELHVQEMDTLKSKLAAMNHLVDESTALLALKNSLPDSYQTSTLRAFAFVPKAMKTYAELRRQILLEYRRKVTADEVTKSFRAMALRAAASHGQPAAPALAPPTPSVQHAHQGPPPATATVFVVRGPDGILRDNKGAVIDCRICGQNHTARNHPTGDAQDLDEGARPPRTPEQLQKLRDKRKSAKIRRAMAKLSSSSGGSEDDESAHSFISRQVNTDSSSATLLRTASRTPGVTLVADSGSDRHGIVDLSLLSDPASANVRIEGIVEGADLVATTTGTLKLEVGGRPLVLRDVLHSGQMSDNILSLQRIADKGATIILRQDGGEIVLDQPVATPADAKTVPLEIGRAHV